MSKEIGSKLKHLRKTRKLTQQEIADKVDIKRSTISNYEIGRRTPHLKDLQKLAATFGVGLDYFGVIMTNKKSGVFAPPFLCLIFVYLSRYRVVTAAAG